MPVSFQATFGRHDDLRARACPTGRPKLFDGYCCCRGCSRTRCASLRRDRSAACGRCRSRGVLRTRWCRSGWRRARPARASRRARSRVSACRLTGSASDQGRARRSSVGEPSVTSSGQSFETDLDHCEFHALPPSPRRRRKAAVARLLQRERGIIAAEAECHLVSRTRAIAPILVAGDGFSGDDGGPGARRHHGISWPVADPGTTHRARVSAAASRCIIVGFEFEYSQPWRRHARGAARA